MAVFYRQGLLNQIVRMLSGEYLLFFKFRSLKWW